MTHFQFTRKMAPALKPVLKFTVITLVLAGVLWLTPVAAVAQSMTLDLGGGG
ncbi:MAG: hypothetical protein JKY17_06985, partial [Magnetovibrio sp.]|nr:hypothetical protein [Magnetovibrio sp.]